MARKIMVCDDDEGILEMMEMLLGELGYEVVAEQNSTSALKTMIEQRPDLLLLDIWMPVMSGDQVLKSIKLDQRLSAVPIIMYSASTEGKAIASAACADDYISKPFDMEELETKIAKLLEATGGN